MRIFLNKESLLASFSVSDFLASIVHSDACELIMAAAASRSSRVAVVLLNMYRSTQATPVCVKRSIGDANKEVSQA